MLYNLEVKIYKRCIPCAADAGLCIGRNYEDARARGTPFPRVLEISDEPYKGIEMAAKIDYTGQNVM